MQTTLAVNEIFLSIQGEGTRAGRPCALVRLGGCNLRCRWCDTRYAYDQAEEMPVDAVVAAAGALGCRLVMVTGGEPMLQPATPELLLRLCEDGREALLQTNGSLDVTGVDARVVRCLDVKCPGSGQAAALCPANLRAIRATDEVKFVLADRADYDYARAVMGEYDLAGRCPVIFSPVNAADAAGAALSPAELVKWILADKLDVRLGLQLHKIIWPGVERGV
jgi:7-carboxy-7-deazaguanine synthase